MKKLRLIIQREFIAKVRNKSFIIMTFLSPLIMIGMGALIVFLTKKNDSKVKEILYVCLLYTSPSPRDGLLSRMPSSA